jgi:hypothetical protein
LPDTSPQKRRGEQQNRPTRAPTHPSRRAERHEKDALAKQITTTDRQIDALVYQLYSLAPEEIAFIEKQHINTSLTNGTIITEEVRPKKKTYD